MVLYSLQTERLSVKYEKGNRPVFQQIMMILIYGSVVHLVVTWYFGRFLSAYMRPEWVIPDLILFIAQIIFQWIGFVLLRHKDFVNYAVQVSFVSFAGSVLLGITGWILNILAHYGFNIVMLAAVNFGLVLMFMFYEHWHRVACSGYSKWLCLSWVLFRLLICCLVFNIHTQ